MSLLDEGKANTHLTHLEELVLTQGQKGYDMARAFLLELLEELKGNVDSRVKTSVKWDGAPAIFAGINPENGKFFVGTKSIFNKVPKINYTPQDIINNHSKAEKDDDGNYVPDEEGNVDHGGLVDKLLRAFEALPKLGIKKILQGDFMFDDTMIKTIDIDGEPHYAFKPNTITYAAPVNSKLGQQIADSKFGIVFHTTYDRLDSGASFGADVSGLNKVPGVWVDDAYFTDDTGTVTLTEDEEAKVEELVAAADQVNEKIDYEGLPMDLLNIYINSEVKKGEFLENPKKSFEEFLNWYTAKLKNRINKLKTKRGIDNAKQQGKEKLKAFKSREEDILNLFKVSRRLFEAKNIFIAKYNNAVYNTKHFIDDGSGDLVASNPEGYVAVDRIGNGVKFVDRLEFSKANFAVDKGAKFQQTESLTVFWGSDGFSVTKTLLEWSRNLPSVENKNQDLYENLLGGAPITSLVREASKVKIALAEAVNWALNEQEGERIAAVAGGFKPPHKGHMEMISHYADLADKVKLFIGASPRGIKGDPQGRQVSAAQSLAIWAMYLEDAGLEDKVDVEIIQGSPMKASYSVLEDAVPGQTILMGCGAKDTYFTPEALAKYAPEGVDAEPAPCPNIVDPNTKQPYSATAVRATIRDNDLNAFARFLPETSSKRAEEIFALLGGALEEVATMAGGAAAFGVGVPQVVGSKKKKKKVLPEEQEIVTEVLNYLLGISVG